MNQDNKKPGPERIARVVGDVLEKGFKHGHRLDGDAMRSSLELTQKKLSEICLACQIDCQDDHGPVPTRTPVDAAPTKSKHKNERFLFLLRLISCKMSHLFDGDLDDSPLPRSITQGIDGYLRRIFSQSVYDHLNGHAETILDSAGNNDTDILNAIADNPFHSAFTHNVYIRFGLSFNKYKMAKDAFISEVNMALPSGAQPIAHNEFRLIMGALLSDIFLACKTDLNGALIDYQYGPRTTMTMRTVAESFGKDI